MTNPVSVTINVQFVNHAPFVFDSVAGTIENQDVTILLNVTDVDPGQSMEFTIRKLPENGTLFQVNAAGQKTTQFLVPNQVVDDGFRRVIYSPNQYFNGYDSFEWSATDSLSAQSARFASVSVSIGSVNQGPVAVTSPVQSTYGDEPVTITLTASDPDHVVFRYAIVELPQRGVLRETSSGSIISTVPYIMQQGSFVGSVQVTFEPVMYKSGNNYAGFKWNCEDPIGQNLTQPAAVTINVAPKNHAPLVHSGLYGTLENTDILMTLNATEYDPGQTLMASIRKLPTNGTLFQISGSGQKAGQFLIANQQVEDPFRRVIYSPRTYYNGLDQFEWSVSDGSLQSQSATAQISVGSVNQNPEFPTGSLTFNIVPGGEPVTIIIPVVDVDETKELTFVSNKGRPSRGTWKDQAGSDVNFNQHKVSVSQLPLKLQLTHDAKGGAYPYAQFEIVAYDSDKHVSPRPVNITFLVDCPIGTLNIWSSEGDLCLKCPEGAICSREGLKMPFNANGFFKVNNGTFVRCYPETACPEGAAQLGGACG